MKRLSFVPAALLFDNQRVEDALKSVPTGNPEYSNSRHSLPGCRFSKGF